MIQVKFFEIAGGGVVHGVLARKGRASVWFGPTGNVIDVEYFPSRCSDVTHALKPGSPLWNRITQRAAAEFSVAKGNDMAEHAS